jgi:hypothetical protein
VVNRRLRASSATPSFHPRVSIFTVLKLYVCEDSIDILLAILTLLALGIQQESSQSNTARELADVIALSHDQIKWCRSIILRDQMEEYSRVSYSELSVSPFPPFLSSSRSFLIGESADYL